METFLIKLIQRIIGREMQTQGGDDLSGAIVLMALAAFFIFVIVRIINRFRRKGRC